METVWEAYLRKKREHKKLKKQQRAQQGDRRKVESSSSDRCGNAGRKLVGFQIMKACNFPS